MEYHNSVKVQIPVIHGRRASEFIESLDGIPRDRFYIEARIGDFRANAREIMGLILLEAYKGKTLEYSIITSDDEIPQEFIDQTNRAFATMAVNDKYRCT